MPRLDGLSSTANSGAISGEISVEWLGSVLAQHLRPVGAPEALWDSVRLPRVRHTAPRRHTGLAWASMVALALLAVAGLWSARRQPGALAGRTAQMDFYSPEATEIRSWIQAKTGMQVPLIGSRSIQLIGVRIAPPGTKSVEVAYQAAGQNAILAVSQSPAGLPGSHASLKNASLARAKTASWVTGNQIYTLACTSPEALHAACALCHA